MKFIISQKSVRFAWGAFNTQKYIIVCNFVKIKLFVFYRQVEPTVYERKGLAKSIITAFTVLKHQSLPIALYD